MVSDPKCYSYKNGKSLIALEMTLAGEKAVSKHLRERVYALENMGLLEAIKLLTRRLLSYRHKNMAKNIPNSF